ncbi:MAG TPA: hypothetical protein VN706_23070 [Gemmatimonadaceae bacterium]|nr:hypothetical protein [Gemmatimonadaceae bacterium]
MRLARTLAFAALLVAPTVLRAQAAEQDSVRTALIQMKSDLRNLVVAQEAFFADHSAYAAQMEGLKFQSTANVSVSLTATQNNAWAAEARSTLLPNVVCGIYINLPEKYQPKVSVETHAAEGEPTCADVSKKP